MTTHGPTPARLAALKSTPAPELKKQWRELFDSEPPPFNRRYLESRLAYRIQELAMAASSPRGGARERDCSTRQPPVPPRMRTVQLAGLSDLVGRLNLVDQVVFVNVEIAGICLLRRSR